MDGGIERQTRSSDRLSDRSVKSFIAKANAGTAEKKKLSDGGGLYMAITPAGSPVWRLKYRFGGKERLYAIGVYPAIGLEAARKEREVVKAHLRDGNEPSRARLLSRAVTAASSDTTFEGVAKAWLAKRKPEWSNVHYLKSRRALERDVLPLLGDLPVSQITPAIVARAIEAIAARGAHETASKILWNVVCVFRFAQARGLCTANPAQPVREVLPRRKEHTPRPALLTFEELGDFLRRADVAALSPAVRLAHRLTAFTGARIGNVITAEWDEFLLDAELPEWRIPRKKMKSREKAFDHRILLGATIVSELRYWREATGGLGYVFPSPTGRAHITHESIEKAYRVTLGMAGKHSPHGWRSALSSLARDEGFSRDVVELTLDHVHDNAVARAYDRGERLAERIRLMAWWDSQLSLAQSGAAHGVAGGSGKK